ncbi:efflux RND transporter periplasmic adaptor subunit [Pontibacter silvestris]|uniref:Efflux RND transporter periplasmic adaptor subunit n=1 Tax=Pontibacter silvestris TaxID=2305183 RepID=A0ABW4X1V3_9BACT|nr:efflux RND transporter periplasmic adaptor subunit [Pontibacter silvestris]MCC9135046.1 efflux RND transporter periplasmic adaptor subunit [Pontibacter silvestris]
MKRIIIIVVIVGLLGLVALRLFSNKKEIDANNQIVDNTNTTVAVSVAPVESRISERNLAMVGTVVPNKEINVLSEVQGQITSLNVALGDFVRKGSVIARIDDQIRALGVANAEQSLADARQNYERYTNLYNGGAATKAQLDQYTLAYENAQNQLKQARKELSNTTITAPISGYVTQKPVETGAFANIGTPVATLVDVSQLKVQLSVPERNVYALNEGDPVTITTSVYPGVKFNGKITFISARGDEAHNYPIEIAIQNQDKNPLKAGTYVDITFNKKNEVPTLQIPREALVGSIKDARVYVVNSNNMAVVRNITIGADNGTSLEVLEGLQEGDRVVTTGQINLTDSTRVQVVSAQRQ